MLAGVRGVSNNIDVATKQVHVQDVKGKIETALKRNAEIDSKKIVVQAGDGKVTLSGTVRSWVERQDAVNAAWSAPGVKSVVDQRRTESNTPDACVATERRRGGAPWNLTISMMKSSLPSDSGIGMLDALETDLAHQVQR